MRYLVIAEKSEVSRAIESAISRSKYGPGDQYRSEDSYTLRIRPGILAID